MIAAARKRHRAMIFLLGVIVPIVFVWGIMSRRQMPLIASVEAMPAASTKVGEARFEIDGQLLQADVMMAGGRYHLKWTQSPALKYPDVLVYWQSGENLDNAILVGSYSAHHTSFVQEVPSGAVLKNAKVVLYSLAHQQQLGVQSIESAKGGQP